MIYVYLNRNLIIETFYYVKDNCVQIYEIGSVPVHHKLEKYVC
jgi:hypothetical protein